MSARRVKVVPLPTLAAKPEPRMNHDLLDEARKDAFVLLLALDGIRCGAGTYNHEKKDIEGAALSGLAAALSTKLAAIGRQAAGEGGVMTRSEQRGDVPPLGRRVPRRRWNLGATPTRGSRSQPNRGDVPPGSRTQAARERGTYVGVHTSFEAMPAARALEAMLEIHGAPVRRGMTSPLSALFHDIEAARRRERER